MLKTGRSSSAVVWPVVKGPGPVPSSRMVAVAVALVELMRAPLVAPESWTRKVSAPS